MQNSIQKSGQFRLSELWYDLTYDRYIAFQAWRNRRWEDEAALVAIPAAWGFRIGRIGYYIVTSIPKSPWFWVMIFSVPVVLGLRWYIKHANQNPEQGFNFSPSPSTSLALMAAFIWTGYAQPVLLFAWAIVFVLAMYSVRGLAGLRLEARAEQQAREVVA